MAAVVVAVRGPEAPAWPRVRATLRAGLASGATRTAR